MVWKIKKTGSFASTSEIIQEGNINATARIIQKTGLKEESLFARDTRKIHLLVIENGEDRLVFVEQDWSWISPKTIFKKSEIAYSLRKQIKINLLSLILMILQNIRCIFFASLWYSVSYFQVLLFQFSSSYLCPCPSFLLVYFLHV